MSGLNGDYQSLAEAVGEREPEGLVWTAEDMAGWQEEDFEAARLAMENEAYERAGRLEDECAALRAEVQQLRAEKAETAGFRLPPLGGSS